MIHVNDVYELPDASPLITADRTGATWRDVGVFTDVTLSLGVPTTDVPASFLLQDKILRVAFTMKDPSEA